MGRVAPRLEPLEVLELAATDEAAQPATQPPLDVAALVVRADRARAEGLLDTALLAIDTLGDRAEPLRELARFAVRRSE